MKTILVFLSHIGLPIIGPLMMLLGFYSKNAAEFPLVLKTLSPSSYRAQTGLAKLTESGRLTPQDIGFEELCGPFFAGVAAQNPRLPSDLSFESINLARRANILGKPLVQEVKATFTTKKAEIEGKPEVTVDMQQLDRFVNKLQSKQLFVWAQAFFWPGFVVALSQAIQKFRNESSGRNHIQR